MEKGGEIGWGWAFGRYIVLLLIVTGGMLFIDPNYFDTPLGSALIGLEAKDAPGPTFATAVTVVTDRPDPIEIVLGAKDQTLAVLAEVTDPNDLVVWTQNLQLQQKGGPNGSPQWESRLVGISAPGTYTLKVQQHGPGRIKVYFFQGPFVTRLVLLPLAVLLLSFIFSLARRKRNHPALPEPT